MSAATRGMVPRRGTSAEVGRHIWPLARDTVGEGSAVALGLRRLRLVPRDSVDLQLLEPRVRDHAKGKGRVGCGTVSAL
jgi:hypothetical protein